MLKPALLTLVFFLNIYFAKWLSVIDIHFPVQQFTAGCNSRHFANTSEIVWWWRNWSMIKCNTQCLGPLCIWKCFSDVTYIWSEYLLVQKQFSFTYTWHIWSTIWQVPGRGNGQYGENVFVFDIIFVTIIAKGRNWKYGKNCKSCPSQVSQFRL